MSRPFLEEWNSSDELWLLDGPVGTQLSARGFDVDRPGWSARAILEAPELLTAIHRDYVTAGARLVTANTFRTHAQNLQGWTTAGRARELTARAVELARSAAGTSAWVVGSVAPVGDCYSPDEVPGSDELQKAHAAMARNLADCHVDAVLLETHVSHTELVIAAQANFECHTPLLISVYSPDGTHLADGTPLRELPQLVEPFQPLAIGVNCLPCERVAGCLQQLRLDWAGPLLVYANAGEMLACGTWRPTAGDDPAAHTAFARTWLAENLRVLGGCCGTGPDLIANFSRSLSR